jgi:hypothetical protein
MCDRRLPTQPSQRRYAKLRFRLEIDVRQAGVDSSTYLNNAEFRNIVTAQIKEVGEQIVKDKNLELAQAGEMTFTAGTILVETVWTVVGIADRIVTLVQSPPTFDYYERRLARNLAVLLRHINDFVIVVAIEPQLTLQGFIPPPPYDPAPYVGWVLAFLLGALAIWSYQWWLREPGPLVEPDLRPIRQALRKIEGDIQTIYDRLLPRGSSCDLRVACSPDCYDAAARVPPRGVCR